MKTKIDVCQKVYSSLALKEAKEIQEENNFQSILQTIDFYTENKIPLLSNLIQESRNRAARHFDQSVYYIELLNGCSSRK